MTVSQKELEYKADYLAKFNQYLEKQHPIVRGLHVALKVLSLICFALTIIFFIAAMVLHDFVGCDREFLFPG